VGRSQPDPDRVEFGGDRRPDGGAVCRIVPGAEHLGGVQRDRNSAPGGALAHGG